MKNSILILFACLNLTTVKSQIYPENIRQRIDSLELIVQTTNNDSIKVKALFAWDLIIYAQQPELDVQLNSKIFDICSKNIKPKSNSPKNNFFIRSKGVSAGFLGIAEFDKGNSSKALQLHQINLALCTKINDSIGIGQALNNIGIVYQAMGDQERAIPYLEKSYNIRTSLNEMNAGYTLNNLGLAQKNLGNYKKALAYFNQGIDLFEQYGNKGGISLILGNKANVYKRINDLDSAIIITLESLEMALDNGDISNKASCYSNLGDFYLRKADSSLNSTIQERDSWRIKSIEYSLKGLEISEKYGYKRRLRNVHENLAWAFRGLGRNDEAFFHLERYMLFKDSLNSEENQKELIRFELQASYDKQAAADSVKAAELQKVTDAQIESQNAQISKDRTLRFSLIGGISLVCFFGIFIYNRLKLSQKQNAIIDKQKSEVENQKEEVEKQKLIAEEKNQEILDSINYAKRIQSAILPSKEALKSHLTNGFILYKPKDVVAGDFYWMEKKGNKVLFAAADCTGHGVPGAMVSVVCNNALNRSVREFKLEEPGLILDKTREIVIQEFATSDTNVKDGMDIALCSIEGNVLEYAGAHNPLWLIRNNEIIEFKADKQPIGRFEFKSNFKTHKINLEKGDAIYIFSDGYVDQFGGDKGKKLKPKALREILIKNQHLSMDEQKNSLENLFENWRGSIEQIDDVCIIGVKY